MQNKKVKHRPSTKYLYFHKITDPTQFFSGDKKKFLLPTDQIIFQHVCGDTAIFFFTPNVTNSISPNEMITMLDRIYQTRQYDNDQDKTRKKKKKNRSEQPQTTRRTTPLECLEVKRTWVC